MSDRKQIYMLARAVESSVFQALMLAYEAHQKGNERECRKWENQADMLDKKFKTQYNMHYSSYIEEYIKNGH